MLVELSEELKAAVARQVGECKKELIERFGDFKEVPEQFKALWTSTAHFTALHSIQHQIVKAVPLVVLSSSLDVDGIVMEKQGKTTGYFYDTTEGGNGAAEAMFSNSFDEEGRKSEDISVAYPTRETAVIVYTIIGLADDSVGGIRNRIELKRNQNKWEIVWVGEQYKCQLGRGHQDWSDRLCS